MSVGLGNVIVGKETKPPRVIVYGPRGVGKTTFAAGAKSPVIIQTEDGTGILDVARFPIAGSFQDVIDAIAALYREAHDYKTVVLDSLDWCERLVHEQVRKEHNPNIFSEYGRGYVLSLPLFERIINGLNALRDQKGMTVVVVAHSIVKRFESPETEPYDRYKLDLHEKAASLFEEWADVVLFANQRVYTTTTDTGFGKKRSIGVGKGERVMYTEERPSHVAKNRYRLPYELPLEWGALARAIAASMKPAAAAAQTEKQTNSKEETTNG